MSALHSRGFHMSDSNHNESETDYAYQDPEFLAKSPTQLSRSQGRSTAFRIKQQHTEGEWLQETDYDMGQGHSQHYIDVFDDDTVAARRQQERYFSSRRSEPSRRGHTNNDSQEYCYAYSSNYSRDNTEMRNKPNTAHIPQRSVSLKDDYSLPPDRLSSSGTTTDYIEPYQSQGVNKVVSGALNPDPGGFYALARDVEELRAPADRKSVKSDHYNHLSSALKQVDISHPEYDHVNFQSTRTNTLPSTDSANEQFVSAESSPVRKYSNVSDDVFHVQSAMNKTSPNIHLPANYEDPWDSEEGQKKFSLLMNRAEKQHVKRQSVDKQTPGAKTAAENADQSVNIQKLAGVMSPGSSRTTVGFTETVADNQRHASESQQKTKPKTKPKPHQVPVVGNYEDAWDLPEKQKEFEEKLLQARIQRASQGQVREEDGIHPKERLNSVSSQAGTKQEPFVLRSDSCRSLAALAEKVDVKIPLEEQTFYHGSIKRSAAERKLLVFKEGSYLIRRSETCKSDFSLTLKGWNGQPMHMKIACKPDGTYVLGENSPPFETIPEMVEYYTKHELPVQNADRICLLYPIPC